MVVGFKEAETSKSVAAASISSEYGSLSWKENNSTGDDGIY